MNVGDANDNRVLQMSAERLLYYLPGFGGRIDTGLGQGLLSRGWSVTGRATVGDFRGLQFQAQIDTVSEDLKTHFWRVDARVIANSFGGYLFLHASLSLPPFPGRVLLLSPIVGAFEDGERAMSFVPPRAEALLKKAAQGLLPSPASCEIWVGAEDWQSVPQQVEKLGAVIGANVTVVQGRGHLLGEDVVGPLLDRWLKP
jgi:hypothetical protein